MALRLVFQPLALMICIVDATSVIYRFASWREDGLFKTRKCLLTYDWAVQSAAVTSIGQSFHKEILLKEANGEDKERV